MEKSLVSLYMGWVKKSPGSKSLPSKSKAPEVFCSWVNEVQPRALTQHLSGHLWACGAATFLLAWASVWPTASWFRRSRGLEDVGFSSSSFSEAFATRPVGLRDF